MSDFQKYTEASFSAFTLTHSQQDVIDKKKELLDTVLRHNNVFPKTVLVIGFTPMMFAFDDSQVTVVNVSSRVQEFLSTNHKNIKVIDKLTGKYDCVITSDEYFTFSPLEDQAALVDATLSLANNLVITTVKDYKNLDFKEREFSTPAVVKNTNVVAQYLEYHSSTGRNTWETTVSEIINNKLTTYGPFPRSCMYFKQLAKFSMDAGAKEFLVHKNLMNKSLIRKNYDHIVSIKV